MKKQSLQFSDGITQHPDVAQRPQVLCAALTLLCLPQGGEQHPDLESRSWQQLGSAVLAPQMGILCFFFFFNLSVHSCRSVLLKIFDNIDLSAKF